MLRKKRMFSNFEKIIENILFYRFKSRISDFNKNGIRAKYFLLVFWKVARKRYSVKPFNKVTEILSRIHVSKKIPDVILFQGMFGKTALLKVLKHSQKKFFSRDTFKRFELFNLSSFYVIALPNLLPTAILKTDTSENVSCECYSWARIFKIHGRASVVKALLREITVLLHSTKLSRKLHHEHCYVRNSSSTRNFGKLPFD